MNVGPHILEAAHAHALREYPREACGLVVRLPLGGPSDMYWPCVNLADGQAHFILCPQDYARAEEAGEVVGIVHSHPNGAPEPSSADRVMMEQWGVPWLIISAPLGHSAWHYPTGYEAPLVGRPFSHGVLDCFSLIRDYYRLTLGITLPEFDRPDDWWAKGANLYLDNYHSAGFRDVGDSPPQAHDVILMQVRSKVPNHGAVYLGDDVILHHVMNRLSRREVYSGFWSKITTHILRHSSL